MSINSCTLDFDGEILKRGFWLYLWVVVFNGQKYIYVGRTGDESLANAASPFSGLSQHLDLRRDAQGNDLARCLREVDLDPRACHFRMRAFGPIFEEQETLDKHEPYRDQMTMLEYEIASYLKWRGFEVLGQHQKGTSIKQSLLNEIKARVIEFVST
jgi:hypothetical protein